MNIPPLFISHFDADHYIDALLPHEKTNFETDIRKLLSLNLPPVVSIPSLGVLFGFSSQFIRSMYYRTEQYYSSFTIPKGHGKRQIQAPRIALKIILSWFGHNIAQSINLQPCVYGFVKGKSFIQAASIHCAANWVFSTDIKDFFPSTSKSFVEKALISIGYPEHGADIISKLCCYKGGLAQGSPASPVLSNLVFKEADEEIISLANDLGINYTRYADDLVFSGCGNPPDHLDISVRTIIEKYGWKVADRKQTMVVSPKTLKVHGLIVSGTTPRLTKSYRNRIRAFRHIVIKLGKKAKNYGRIQGHLAHAKAVEEFTKN